MTINTQKARQYLQAFEFKKLFINELGWNNPQVALRPVPIEGLACTFTPIAEAGGGMIITECHASDGNIPTSGIRQQIDKYVEKSFHEHIIIYVDKDRATSRWTWIKRDNGSGRRERGFDYRKGQPGDSLLQRLAGIAFRIDELDDEGRVSIATVTSRVARAFDVDTVTKKFYDLFQKEHDNFISFLTGLQDVQIRAWYTSVMLNRMMFLYFVQKKGFLNADRDYLRHKLEESQERGKDRFYRDFLLILFFQGLASEENERDAKTNQLLGKIPYLNGGIFLPHQIEEANANINIADAAFERLFDFFDSYRWHLDDRPLRQDNEINPDVLGYIFEKYINQKQMGAYYTKEDITDYICKYTILPFLLDKVGFNVAQAMHDVDSYIYEAVSTEAYLPTETEREYSARRKRYEQIRADFAAGKISTVNDLITYNLDIREFVEDYLRGPEMTATPIMLRRFYKALTELTILDPTCGSGAFLFAAMNILEPLYEHCLDKMKLVVASKDGFKYDDFKRELERVDQHPNRRYFVYKSIIINNLYGVDIMDEAVEICKLRLFLKLVSQVDDVKRIEPLPDIDFNIRAGNTLVGFATKEEIGHQSDSFRLYNVEDIMRKVEDADSAMASFRKMQTSIGVKAAVFKEAKKRLNATLADIRGELDTALMQDYGLNDLVAFRRTHKPFHWYMEFNRVMANGGFDVIVGNPPYVEYSKVRGEYTIRGYDTERSGNLFAFVVERAFSLKRTTATFGMILPLSTFCTQRMMPVWSNVRSANSQLWVSHFGMRPAGLFQGLILRLSILLYKKGATSNIYTTTYNKWGADYREYLLKGLAYIEANQHLLNTGVVPKTGFEIENRLIDKVLGQSTRFERLVVSQSRYIAYYRNTGVAHWITVTSVPPKAYRLGSNELSQSSRQTCLYLKSGQARDFAVCCLTSSLFLWFYLLRTNCRDLNPSDINTFPISRDIENDPRFADLAKRLMESLDANSSYMTRNQKLTGEIKIQSFNVRFSKPVIDDIDRVLAQHYGFTDEELDFIINYDIKYRMGRDSEDGDRDDS